MKVKVTVSITAVMLVLIFILQFVSFPYFSWYNLVKYGIIVSAGIFIIPQYKLFLKKRYMVINLLAILFCMLTVYASYINRSRVKERNPFLASIVFVATFILFLFFVEIIAEKEQIKRMIGSFYKTAFVIAVITDIIMFMKPELVITYRGNYFIGTKFSVVYLHLFLIALYLAKINFQTQKRFRKKRLVALGVWNIVVGIYVHCATGIVGLVVLYVLIYIIEKRERLFLNCIMFTVIQLSCFAFVYINQRVLNNSLVQGILRDILKRDITLTSRTKIFELVPQLLIGNTTWGFGYGTSYELGMRLGGFPDTQNGILEWVWQVGVPTTIIMLIMFASFFFVSNRYENNRNKKIIIPILACVYLLTILGTVEITIGTMYFALLIMVFGISIEDSTNDRPFKKEKLDDYPKNM